VSIARLRRADNRLASEAHHAKAKPTGIGLASKLDTIRARGIHMKNGKPLSQSSNVVQFSKDQIAMLEELRLRADECQQCTGQGCDMPVMLKVHQDRMRDVALILDILHDAGYQCELAKDTMH
jgi:hypothetical protein